MIRIARALAIANLGLIAVSALAHDGDLKMRDWRPPVEAAVWRADDGATSLLPPSFRASGVRLMAWFPVKSLMSAGTSVSDIWGYESPSGREYALVGQSQGTAIVEVTNPGSSTLVAFLKGPTSVWRNVKTYQHWMYAVSEGGSGIQVFDLADIDAGTVTQVGTIDASAATPATHTMVINEQTGFLYRLGGGSMGVRAYDLKPNPAAPVMVGSWSARYVHDGAVRSIVSGPLAGHEILFACGGLSGGYGDTRLEILDVTSKSAIASIGSLSYPSGKYCHGIAISDDLKTGWINDEMDEQNGQFSRGITVDLSDLTHPTMLGTYTTGEHTVDHNNYARGNRLYCSNYTSGLRVFDTSDPASPRQIAWFDTYPEDDAAPAAIYNGLWSNYPYFRSGTIVGSDINRGLFVWRLEGAAGTARVSRPDGSWLDPAGEVVAVRLDSLRPDLAVQGTPQVSGTVGGAAFRSDLVAVSDGQWNAQLPSGACGTPVKWSISFPLSDGTVLCEPWSGQFDGWLGLGELPVVTDDCEASTGWTIGFTGDTATAGQWVNVTPSATAAQTGANHTPGGSKCWVTGVANDVDGGKTSLVTPDYPLAGVGEPMLSYWRWYTNSTGGLFSGPYVDTLEVYASSDGGVTWSRLESVQDAGLAWVRARFRLRDALPSGAQRVRLRFVASDTGTDSEIEAAIDDLRISDALCTESQACDLDRSHEVDMGDAMLVLMEWGPVSESPADIDRSGAVDLGDLAMLLLNLGPVQ